MSEPYKALLFALNPSEIPTEIELFGAGMTETQKGSFKFDSEAAAQVMATFSENGADRLPFDVQHQMLSPGAHPESYRALGWFVPTISESGALMASDIEWTEAGRQALENREFRFFSPAITFNPETRRLTSLINVALTNLPATKNQEPLVLDGADLTNSPQEPQMQVLLDKLGAADEASAVAKLSELEARLSSVDDELITAQAELAALEVKRVNEAKASKIAELSASGKLPPAQREFAESLELEQLEKFAATLSAATVVTAPKIEEPGDPIVKLSAQESEIIIGLGISEEDYLKEKAKREAKKGAA